MQLIGEREQVPVVRWACVSVGGNQSVVWRLGVRELAAPSHKFIPISPCPHKNSSHNCWHRCQSTFNECVSLIIPESVNH